VRAVFYRPDTPDTPVGQAVWDGRTVEIQPHEDGMRAALERIFRPSPVAVDDPALRTAGTAGPVVLAPGSLAWFRAAARTRSAEEGLAGRVVSDGRRAIGWDPAGAYRPFSDALERTERLGARGRPPGRVMTPSRSTGED
jgi:hypothetical protein